MIEIRTPAAGERKALLRAARRQLARIELTALNHESAYSNALKRGPWTNTYARAGRQSYWAEGVQSDFKAIRVGPCEGDGIHGHVNSRRELICQDPKLYRLIEETFGPGS